MEAPMVHLLLPLLAVVPGLILFLVICGIFARVGRVANRLDDISAQIASIGAFLADARARGTEPRSGPPPSL
jgi:hypothetical protein